MRLIIEVTDAERDALRKLCADLGNVAYSALVRALLRMTHDGAVPRAALLSALSTPRRALLAPAPKSSESGKKLSKVHTWDRS